MPDTKQVKTFETMDDIFNDIMSNDVLGIFDNIDPQGILMTPEQHEAKYGGSKKSRNKYHAIDGEITAVQQVCRDYADYAHIIDKAINDVNTIDYQKTVATKSDIIVGSVVVFKGLLGVVVALNASEARSSGESFRAHIVFANETESHLLLSTVSTNTYKDFSYLVRFNNSQA